MTDIQHTHQNSACTYIRLTRIAQSVWQLATDWTVRGSNPGGGEIFRTRPDRPWAPSSLLFNRDQFFHGGKEAGGGGVALTTHPQLAPRFKKEYSYTSISSPPSGLSCPVLG